MKRLAIVGSGDLGQQIAYHAAQSRRLRPVGFFDDTLPVGTSKGEFSVLGGVNDIERVFSEGGFDALIMGIGYKHMEARKQIFNRFVSFIPFENLIHPSSYVDESCTLGKGVVVYPGCTVDMYASLGDNTLLNVGCVIAHHSSVGAHSFLSPAVRIAGFTQVEEGVNLGIGTTIIDNITIASGVRTGAGAVVTRNLEQPGLYVGVPAALK